MTLAHFSCVTYRVRRVRSINSGGDNRRWLGHGLEQIICGGAAVEILYVGAQSEIAR